MISARRSFCDGVILDKAHLFLCIAKLSPVVW